MIKRALPAVAAIFALSVSLSAQESTRLDVFQSPGFSLVQASPSAMVEGRAALARRGSFRSVHNAWYGGGPLTLVDNRSFSFPGTFGWVEAATGDILPAFSTAEIPSVTAPPMLAQTESNPKPQLFPKPDYVGGEVGFFFGKSIGGKYNRQVEAGYLFGRIIEGNTQITVGASYGHESGNFPHVIGR